ncbi:MAG: Gfo/Idh/MocA family oxidoreductase [Aigarchaeota archaeon]|nr:Gfo/Idh/MocA family oxidoreductase [Aigarchaeota archaeon]MDW8021182.1 Gfo/Idh/MocA family oxidoreductase [Nitrososphaerota archaeon]
MSGRRVRVCVVGAGRTGRVHATNLSTRITVAELIGVVDQVAEAAKALASELGVNHYASLSEAMKKGDFEAVFITTPTPTHRDLAVEAAEAGKHVFCEKPMALTLGEADEMISAARKNDVKLQIGFMRRFDPEFRKAKELIDQGAIGKPVLVKSVGRGPGLPPRWALDPKTGLGMVAEVNSHDFDSLRWFMNDDFKTIYAEAAALLRPDVAEEFPGFHDVVAVTARFKKGGIGLLDGGCPVGYGYDARLEILGTEGLLTIGEVKGTSMLICHADKKITTEPFSSWRDRFKEAYVAEAESFLKAILGDRDPEVTGEDGRKTLEATLAAIRSIKEHRPIELPLR